MHKYLYLGRKKLQSLFDTIRKRTTVASRFNHEIGTFRSQTLISGTDLPYPTPWESLYPYEKLIVEIGTGHGETIRQLSEHKRNSLVIGFEKTLQFARKSAKKLKGFQNAKVIYSMAYELLPKVFEPNSINTLYILFPDPWHKKKHAKRRPITAQFFETIHKLLVNGGEILIATDWPEYFQFILNQIPNSKFLTTKGSNYKPEKFGLIPTHYYQKWQQEKRTFYWIQMKKV